MNLQKVEFIMCLVFRILCLVRHFKGHIKQISEHQQNWGMRKDPRSGLSHALLVLADL